MNTTKEKIKTVLICLLLVGMAYLTYSVWFFDSPFGELELGDIFDVSGNGYISDGAGEDLDSFGIRPLAIVFTEDKKSRGAVYDQAMCDRIYKELRTGISSALKRAKELRTSTDQAWEKALAGDGVFLDYRGNLSFEALKLWLGENPGSETVCGRYFIFSTEGRNITIYIKDTEAKKVYMLETSAASDTFRDALQQINASPVEFAITRKEEDFSFVFSEMIIPEQRKNPNVISSYNSLEAFQADTVNACLETFGLRGAAPSRYFEKDGTEVYIADMVTLKISPDGIATYTDLRDEADETLGIRVESETEEATLAERCESARSVAEGIGTRVSGAGGIYISSVVLNGKETEIILGRQIDGIPVDMRNTSYFARVVIKNNIIGEMRINLRGYETLPQTTEVVPERLIAAAVKGSGEKHDLNLRYKDLGEGSISPSWFDGGMKKKEEGQSGLVKS